MKQTHLFFSAASVGVAMACATSVLAQPVSAPAPTAESGLETVIVTAQRRVEQAQKTPISMTVVTTQEIKNRSIANLSDLQQLTPGLNFEQSTSTQFGTNVSMRGLSSTGSGESPVGVYVDGVYESAQTSTGTSTTALTSMVDVARVEVLKGPQGTLYGRNTAGGAINIISNLPTQDPGGELTLGGGNYDSAKVQAIVNVPLVRDVLAFRLAGQYLENSGYAQDLVHGVGLGGIQQWNVRGTLLYTPTPRLQFILRADYSSGSGGGSLVEPLTINTLGASEIALESGLPLTPTGLNSAIGIFNHFSTGARPTLNNQSYGIRTSAAFTSGGASLTASYDLANNLTLKSITAFRDDSSNSAVDLSGTPFHLLDVMVPESDIQVTQELQLNGKLLGDKLNFVTGMYYYYLDQKDNSIADADPLFFTQEFGGNPNPSVTLGDRHDFSFAAYGQATYAVTSRLNITGGLRWTTENKDLVASSFTPFGCSVPTMNLIGGACLGKFETSANNLSYSVNVDFDISKSVMVYAKTSSGFKSGGINAGSSTVGSYAAFKPELVTDYEAGIKSEWFDRRLRMDVSIYQSWYSNLQRSIVTSTDQILTQNAASARIQGVEAEADAEPIHNLLLQATLAYVDPKYLKYVDGLGDNLSGQRFEDQPTWTYSLTGAYTLPTSFGHWRAEIDWSWRSSADLFPSSTLPAQFHVQPAYGLINARLSAHLDAVNLDISLWAKNLANQLYFAEISDLTGDVGSDVGYVGAPRTFGVELTKRF